jgi:hypothetical protein
MVNTADLKSAGIISLPDSSSGIGTPLYVGETVKKRPKMAHETSGTERHQKAQNPLK